MKKVLIVAVLLLGLSILSFSNSRVELPEESCKTFLAKLYNDYIFGDDYDGLKEKVDEMFTEKAKQHLMDEYEYDCDGECYAFWALRTGSQDSGGGESKIREIVHAVGNVYEVSYFDGGWKGSTLFLLTMDNDKVKVDDFLKREDEFDASNGYGSQRATLVFDAQDNLEGKLLFTDGDYYAVRMTDYNEVPMEGRRLVTYNADDGQGFVYTHRSKVNVRESPDTDSSVVTKLPTCPEGEIPQTFPCLGFEFGWYKIRIDDKVGYVRGDLVTWDCADVFVR